MLYSTEQLTTTARTHLDAQMQLASKIAGVLLDGVEKVAGLNLQAAKASLSVSIGGAQALLAAKDAQEFFSQASNQAQPQTDIALTYGQHLSSIASDAQRDLSQVAQNQIDAGSRQWVALLDDAARLTPGGSSPALSMMKSAIDNLSSGYAQLNKSAKVAIDAIESNIQTANARLSANRH